MFSTLYAHKSYSEQRKNKGICLDFFFKTNIFCLFTLKLNRGKKKKE